MKKSWFEYRLLEYKSKFWDKAFDFESQATNDEFMTIIIINTIILCFLNCIILISLGDMSFAGFIASLFEGITDSIIPGVCEVIYYMSDFLDWLVPYDMIRGIQFESLGIGAVYNLTHLVKVLFLLNIMVPTMALITRRIRKIYNSIFVYKNRKKDYEKRKKEVMIYYSIPLVTLILILALFYVILGFAYKHNIFLTFALEIVIVIFSSKIDSLLEGKIANEDRERLERQKKKEEKQKEVKEKKEQIEKEIKE